MIRIEEYLINKKNICCVETNTVETDGYTWKKTYFINIYFMSGYNISFKTYEKEVFDKWLEDLQ